MDGYLPTFPTERSKSHEWLFGTSYGCNLPMLGAGWPEMLRDEDNLWRYSAPMPGVAYPRVPPSGRWGWPVAFISPFAWRRIAVGPYKSCISTEGGIAIPPPQAPNSPKCLPLWDRDKPWTSFVPMRIAKYPRLPPSWGWEHIVAQISTYTKCQIPQESLRLRDRGGPWWIFLALPGVRSPASL